MTAGDLVFQGSDTGDFYAFDARTGEQRFKYTAPRSIRASPITYRVNGSQYVATVATNTILHDPDHPSHILLPLSPR